MSDLEREFQAADSEENPGSGTPGQGGGAGPGQGGEGANPETGQEAGVAIRERLKHPRRFACLLHNDDFTTMEFVVEILTRYFSKAGAEAMDIMLRVHHQGKGVAGIYPFDIAETKAHQVQEFARERGFPLKCTVEPE